MRLNNEDSTIVVKMDLFLDNTQRECSILAVADGVGGSQAGEEASAIAVRSFSRSCFSGLVNNENCLRELMQQCFLEAHSSILDRSSRDPRYRGMCTTLTAVVIDRLYCYIGSVGDSRAYLLRSGEIVRLTKDQSTGGVLDYYLGSESDPTILTSEIELKVGDCLLVCSDGLTNMVQDSVIVKIVDKGVNVATTCNELLDEANNMGGNDNISVALLKIIQK